MLDKQAFCTLQLGVHCIAEYETNTQLALYFKDQARKQREAMMKWDFS